MGRQYGLRVFRHGVELRGDGRKRERLPGGHKVVVRPERRSTVRGKIRAWSLESARRLAFIAANVDLFFKSHFTLTYHARQQAWESLGERNRRVVKRCSSDLHRFLRAVRKEAGEYLWVREFQKRGVVHFHLLTEHAVPEQRAAELWGHATDQLHDAAVLRHGVKVDEIKSQGGARKYLGRYIGKEKQKSLPVGVDGAGRWWGRSRGLPLALLEDICWLDRSDGFRRPIQLRIVRILRRWVEKRFGRRYRGGAFLDYGGELTSKLAAMTARLREHYGWSKGLMELLEAHGWEFYGEGSDGEGRQRNGLAVPGGSQRADERGAEEAGGDVGGAEQAELWPEG